MDNIILYSTGCPRCKVLKDKLAAKHIPFDEVNDVNKMASLGITQVPYLYVDGQMLDFVSSIRWVNDQGANA